MTAHLRDFAALVRAADPEIDLAGAALEIARIEHPDLVAEPYVDALDCLAAGSGVGAADDPIRALHRLREFLFEDVGFRGNVEEYYDPRNSCLNDVLDRRLGIPISLSVVAIEVGRRVGVPLAGIALPGHFIVSGRAGSEEVLLDPFNGGALLTTEAASTLVSRALGRRVTLAPSDFVPATKRQLLTRILCNLKAHYARQRAWQKALDVIDHLIVIDEESPALLRDRGSVLMKLGRLHHGAADWECYLTRCPEASDADRLRHQLRRVRLGLAKWN